MWQCKPRCNCTRYVDSDFAQLELHTVTSIFSSCVDCALTASRSTPMMAANTLEVCILVRMLRRMRGDKLRQQTDVSVCTSFTRARHACSSGMTRHDLASQLESLHLPTISTISWQNSQALANHRRVPTLRILRAPLKIAGLPCRRGKGGLGTLLGRPSAGPAQAPCVSRLCR